MKKETKILVAYIFAIIVGSAISTMVTKTATELVKEALVKEG